MKLKVSFFSTGAVRKDLTRFAPVWIVYLAALLLSLAVVPRQNIGVEAEFLMQLSVIMTGISCVYAGLCAAVLFSDLYKPALCCSLHTLPLRREVWFWSHVASGLLMCIVPNLLVSVILCGILPNFGSTAFLWLAGSCLQYLFFFGVGVYCALSAGNRIGMVLTYTIGNLLGVFLGGFVELIYIPMTWGIRLNWSAVQLVCPAVYMGQANYFGFARRNNIDAVAIPVEIPADIWVYTLCAAALGVVLLGLACRRYRKRDLECAGDFTPYRSLRIGFQLTASAGAGLVFFVAGTPAGTVAQYCLLAAGMAFGFFGSRMLLERSLRVFRRGNAGILLVFLAVFYASLLIVRTDLPGISGWIPNADNVKTVSVKVHNPSESSWELGIDTWDTYILEESEPIQRALQIHRALLADRHVGQDSVQVTLTYELDGGITKHRHYSVEAGSKGGILLGQLYSDWEYIFPAADWNTFAQNVTEISIYNHDYGYAPTPDVSAIGHRGLLEALYKDCEAGTMAQNRSLWENEPRRLLRLNISYNADKANRYSSAVWVYISEKNEYTWNYLKQYGL